jgi:oxygen-independent coproporphyrinogen-3 oxidase
MLTAIVKELQMRKSELALLPETLYFGGGTPSVYSIDELKIIIDEVKKNFGVNEFREFTVEVNPDDLDEKYLDGLLQIGVNRLSIGVQSFINEQLQFMNRRHTAQQAIDCINIAKRAGFSNINIDLIYGLPQMTLQQWQKNIEIFMNLELPHLSAYHLGIENKTVFHKYLEKGTLQPVDENISAQQYEILEKMTADAGFEHYEISNFAKNKLYSIHNTAYWQGKPYIGFGASAHSYDGNNIRRWNIANNKKYIDAINSNQTFWESETLSLTDRYNDFVLTALRTAWGLNINVINEKFGEHFYNCFCRQAKQFIDNELLVCSDAQIKIPAKHFLLSDRIIRELFCV